MKLSSRSARHALALLVAAVAVFGLCTRPAHASWFVDLTYTGTSVVQPSYEAPGIDHQSELVAWETPGSPASGSQLNDVYVTGTLTWQGPGPAPSTVSVTEYLSARAYFAGRHLLSNYGSHVPTIEADIIGLPTGTSVTTTNLGTDQNRGTSFTTTYTVPASNASGQTIVQLPTYRLKSNLQWDMDLPAPAVPTTNRPMYYETDWNYMVDCN